MLPIDNHLEVQRRRKQMLLVFAKPITVHLFMVLSLFRLIFFFVLTFYLKETVRAITVFSRSCVDDDDIYTEKKKKKFNMDESNDTVFPS